MGTSEKKTMSYKGKYIVDKNDSYQISRSKIDFFIQCQRCFYLDRKFAIRRPGMIPFNLNIAVDNLLKNEFDCYREKGEAHPYIKQLGLNAIPFKHENMEKWRANFTGVSFVHQPTNFHVFGAVDDIWFDLDTEELIVVDYKATSKSGEVTIETGWGAAYKRQMEFYQFLLRGSGFKVSNTAYFIYCNGIKDKLTFNETLEFKVSLISYTGNTAWIEPKLKEIHDLLNQEKIPVPAHDCEYCNYLKARYNQSKK